MSSSFEIIGGTQLKGEITPQGAKNEALQILCAVLLTGDEIRIKNIPDIHDVNRLIEILGDFGLEITDTTETRFHCDCSKERVSRALSTLSKKDLDSIIADGESIEVKCQFCNKAYEFTVDELKEMR